MSELQSPEIFRVILDSLQTGIYVVDRDRKIVFWNDGAERITGYHRHDVVGRLSRETIFFHCNDEGCMLCGAVCPLRKPFMMENEEKSEFNCGINRVTVSL